MIYVYNLKSKSLKTIGINGKPSIPSIKLGITFLVIFKLYKYLEYTFNYTTNKRIF